MKAFEHTYKTDVLSTDAKFRKVGTAKTRIRYFVNSNHFEVVRIYIHDKTLPNNQGEEIIREGKDYQVCRQSFALTEESALQVVSFIVSMLENQDD